MLRALKESGFTYSTVTKDAWVAKQIKFCRRRQNLSWSHHYEVAGLEEGEQERLLDLAGLFKQGAMEL